MEAKKELKEVEKLVKTTETFFTLTMNEEEAAVIRYVLGSIYGGGLGREICQRAFYTLGSSGVDYTKYNVSVSKVLEFSGKYRD